MRTIRKRKLHNFSRRGGSRFSHSHHGGKIQPYVENVDRWEDIDLLVVLNKHKPYNTIYFLKPGKGNIQESIYDNSFKNSTLQYLLTFIHAFTGCETTSCIFKQGKNQIIKILLNDSGLQKQAQCFYDPNATPQALTARACEIVSQLYGTKKDKKSLHEQRYLKTFKSLR